MRWPTRRAMYEPMLIHNPLLGQYVPWLAEQLRLERGPHGSCASPCARACSGRTGRAFSARDVVFTFQLLRRYPALDARGLWEHVAAVAAEGEHTVVVTLDQAHAPALEPIAQQAIVPEHLLAGRRRPGLLRQRAAGGHRALHRGDVLSAPGLRGGAQPALLAAGQAGPAGPALPGLRLPTSRPSWPCCTASSTGRGPSSPPSSASTRRAIPSTTTTGSRCSTPPCSSTPTPAAPRSTTCACARRSAWPSTARASPTSPCTATPDRPTPPGCRDAYARYRDPAAVAAGDWVSHDPARAERLLDQAGLRRGPDGRRRRPTEGRVFR